MLSAIMASMVVTKNGRKSRCLSAAKETFFSEPAEEGVCWLSLRESKVVSESKTLEFETNGYEQAVQTLAA
jgi:hypothetical protein